MARAILLPLCATLALASPSLGQRYEPKSVEGRVTIGGEGALTEGVAVLHRVSSGAGGEEVDSTTLASDGSFLFELPGDGPLDDLYFASVSHAGVLYFGEAFTSERPPDSTYSIVVFDTVTAADDGTGAPEVHLVGRTVFLERPARDGSAFTAPSWRVTDAFEIDNRTGRSVVSPDGGATWSHPVPAGARDLNVGHGIGQGDGLVLAGGHLTLRGPLTPGERWLVVNYLLDDPLPSFPAAGRAGQLDVLIREPSPDVEVDALELLGPTAVGEGGTFRRYGSQSVPPRVALIERPAPSSLRVEWAAVIVAMALVLAWTVRGRRARMGGATRWAR